MEMMVNGKENVKKHPEIAECFEEYGRARGPKTVGNFPVGVIFRLATGTEAKDNFTDRNQETVRHLNLEPPPRRRGQKLTEGQSKSCRSNLFGDRARG